MYPDRPIQRTFPFKSLFTLNLYWLIINEFKGCLQGYPKQAACFEHSVSSSRLEEHCEHSLSAREKKKEKIKKEKKERKKEKKEVRKNNERYKERKKGGKKKENLQDRDTSQSKMKRHKIICMGK